MLTEKRFAQKTTMFICAMALVLGATVSARGADTMYVYDGDEETLELGESWDDIFVYGGSLTITGGTVTNAIHVIPLNVTLPIVTVYGTDFAVTTGTITDGQWTPVGGSGTLTGEYEGGDPLDPADDINLLFYSTIAITLVDTGSTPTPGPIDIDIRPGSTSNRIYVWCPVIPVVIPVAIFSTEGFEATELDPANIFLDGAGVVQICGWGDDGYLSTEFDVNEDGHLDLVLLFAMDPEDLEEGTHEAILSVYSDPEKTTELYRGSDTITIVKLY